MGEWLQLALWDVQGFFGDEDARNHAQALREVNAQGTPQDREIYKIVESQIVKEKKGVLGFMNSIADSTKGIFNNIGGIIKGTFSIGEFLTKYFFIILALVGIGIAWWYLRQLKGLGK